MSESAAELIQAFSALPSSEQRAVLIELTRLAQDQDDPLTDQELTLAGEQVFAMYDAEEANHGEASAG